MLTYNKSNTFNVNSIIKIISANLFQNSKCEPFVYAFQNY